MLAAAVIIVFFRVSFLQQFFFTAIEKLKTTKEQKEKSK